MSPAFAGFSFYLFFFLLATSTFACLVGAGFRLQRPSRGQKGVKETLRLQFGTKLDSFSQRFLLVISGLGDRTDSPPGHSWVPRVQNGDRN